VFAGEVFGVRGGVVFDARGRVMWSNMLCDASRLRGCHCPFPSRHDPLLEVQLRSADKLLRCILCEQSIQSRNDRCL
jgi:hypothetical protein